LARQIGVIRFVDPPHARRTAPFDLVKQAGPVPTAKKTVGAGSEKKQFLKRIDRGVDAASAGEWAIVIALRLARTAMFHDAREVMPFAQ